MSAPGHVAYHAEVVGSLLRPDYLKDAVARFDAGAITAAELTAVEDRAVLEAIALQEACGIEVLTDGEMRRRGWTDPLTRGLAGYSRSGLVGARWTRCTQSAIRSGGASSGT